MLTDKDKKQLEEKGLTPGDIEYQLELFRSGTNYMVIERPAVVNDGILSFGETETEHYINLFDQYRESGKKLMKFVPASGAATRMFKEFFACLNDGCTDTAAYPNVEKFLNRLKDFAFFEILDEELKRETGKTADELLAEKDFYSIVNYLVNSPGLNYGHTPKGLIFFHRYENAIRTAFEEHLFEGVKHAESERKAFFHFTISPEFEPQFVLLAENYKTIDDIELSVSFSQQFHSTDTVAVYEDYTPVRKPDGTLLFRPGGHGALIRNLAGLEADMIFIKNIDNIAHGDYIDFSVRYKKLLGGVAVAIKTELDTLVNRLDTEGSLALDAVRKFVTQYFFADRLPVFDKAEDELNFYKAFLGRPLRVAGMVKNEGEPGGGPFWVKYKDMNFATLQIVEKSQINTADPVQKEILEASTHFNPVDMVVMFDRNKHNLADYVDDEAYFISEKSYEGKNIKALEWPGLWNGAMSDWLTVFVELPLETFNPVKVVTDLLRKYHLPKDK